MIAERWSSPAVTMFGVGIDFSDRHQRLDRTADLWSTRRRGAGWHAAHVVSRSRRRHSCRRRPTDDVRTLGVGFGYHVGSDLRIGFNVDRSRRDTDLVGHRYEGYRAGMSVIDGL